MTAEAEKDVHPVFLQAASSGGKNASHTSQGDRTPGFRQGKTPVSSAGNPYEEFVGHGDLLTGVEVIDPETIGRK
ncbi:MAG: hypothetical protein HGB01_03665 [Chlorobiaceae bacterium]|nr:hypothetical protein [Chlorobiaceae bacterium]